MPCNVDVSFDPSNIPIAPAIPGFGIPHALNTKNISPVPSNFPEDLMELFNKFQFVMPPGILKPTLHPNYSKNIFDAIMSLLDKFFPFLMLYKFFLPVLNLIICIIEVLCAIPNPFKLIRAMRRLFRNCIPQFLSIFPVFALISMIMSLVNLLISFVEFLLNEVNKLVAILLKNLEALEKSFSDGAENSTINILKKIGFVICTFQNLFVMLSIFNVFIEVVRNILSLSFSIPPCDNTDPSDQDGCCTPDVCPAIVKEDYTRTTAVFKYLNTVNYIPPFPLNGISQMQRASSYQIYDLDQDQKQKFINIPDAYDINYYPKPIFFPTDSVYTAQTSPTQAAYVIDLKVKYNPSSFNRNNVVLDGVERFITFKNCIMIKVPTTNLLTPINSKENISNGVVELAGGLGYEADGSILRGYSEDGVTHITSQATLENFLYYPTVNYTTENKNDVLSSNDGYTFQNVEYTFKPNLEVLLGKNLVTSGCAPSLALDKGFINSVFAGSVGVLFVDVNDLINSKNGNTFPNPNAAQECISIGLDKLRSDFSRESIAEFKSLTDLCLGKLKEDSEKSLLSLIGIGFDPCGSLFQLSSTLQFTSKPIIVSATLNDRSGNNIAVGLNTDIGQNIADRIKGHITLGEISRFSYDGYSLFTANITSKESGSGSVMISFDNNTFCTNIIPEDINVEPTHTLQNLNYEFVYTPATAGAVLGDDKERHDDSDLQ